MAAGGPKNGVQPGYAELGYTDKEAEQCVNTMIKEERKAAEEAARLAAEKEEEKRILKIRSVDAKKSCRNMLQHGRCKFVSIVCLLYFS